jgi:hypothetical protein
MLNRMHEGQIVEMACDCGAQKFEAKIGESFGWAEIRAVTVQIAGKDGVVREYPGMAAFYPDGAFRWIDYPEFDDLANLPEHREIDDTTTEE